MDRKELYATVKKLGLQEKVKQAFGTNFTQVKSSQLEDFINAHAKGNLEIATLSTQANENSKPSTVSELSDVYEAACLTFLGILRDTGSLEKLMAKL